MILNSKEDVLNHYPLVATFAYRTMENPNQLVQELSQLLSTPSKLLNDETNYIDSKFSHDLKILALEHGFFAEVVDYLRMSLNTKVDPTERHWVYLTLGEIGGSEAYETIISNYRNEEDFAFEGAKRALKKFSVVPIKNKNEMEEK